MLKPSKRTTNRVTSLNLCSRLQPADAPKQGSIGSMKRLATGISVLQMLRYDNLFKLRHKQLLIDRDLLLVSLSIGNPTNTLFREC